MKNLSKIPRNLSAKFCYLEFSNHFEDETIVPKLQENNDKNESQEVQSKPDFTEEEIQASNEADARGMEEALAELDDLPGLTEAEHRLPPNTQKTEFKNSSFQNAPERNINLNDAIRNSEALIASLGDRPGMIPKNFNIEDSEGFNIAA